MFCFQHLGVGLTKNEDHTSMMESERNINPGLMWTQDDLSKWGAAQVRRASWRDQAPEVEENTPTMALEGSMGQNST